MRRLLGLTAVFCLLLGPAAAQTGSTVAIRDADLSDFPQISLVIMVPEDVAAEDIEVLENGSVVEARIDPLVGSGEQVDVVLLVDRSGSMVGNPMQSAIAAAGEFVRQLPASVRVGLVTFGDSARVDVDLTEPRREILSRISSITAAGETALYDGLMSAVSVFEGPAHRNVVLLSDGGDTVSEASFPEALRAAKQQKVNVYSVGLESAETDPKALARLSNKTGGRFSPAATAELGDIYSGIATELKGQYLVSYTSLVGPGEDVTLAVRTPVGEDSRLLVTPAADAAVETPIPRPVPKQAAAPVIGGPRGLLIILGLAFATAFLAAMLLMDSQARARRDRALSARVTFISEESDASGAGEGLGGRVPRPLAALGSSLAAIFGTEKFEAKLEAANVSVTVGELFGAAAGLALVGAATAVIFFEGLLFMMIAAFVCGAIPFALLTRARTNRLLKVQSQLPDVLSVLASSLRAGHSFVQALDTASQEVPDPAGHEFTRVLAEIRLGRPVDEAMNAMADRVGSEDFRWAVLAVNIQRTVGGNLAEVMDTVAATMRERDEIRRQIQTLSAEGRLSIRILTVLPLLLAAYMAKVNPDYIKLLFETDTGLMMVAVASGLLVLGLVWMRKLVNIDV